jgi:hypothetical protein
MRKRCAKCGLRLGAGSMGCQCQPTVTDKTARLIALAAQARALRLGQLAAAARWGRVAERLGDRQRVFKFD